MLVKPTFVFKYVFFMNVESEKVVFFTLWNIIYMMYTTKTMSKGKKILLFNKSSYIFEETC